MNYREVIPSPALQTHINCFWYGHIGTTAADVAFEVLPNLFANIFINLSGRYTLLLGDLKVECLSGQVMLVGARTKLWSVIAKEPSEMIGIKFNPGGLYPFLPVSLEEASDKIIDVASLADNFFVKSLQPLLPESDLESKFDYMDQLFLSQIKLCQPLHGVIEKAVSLINQSHGQAKVEDIAAGIAISKRSLERYFLKHVGLSPKSISRIIRIRAAIDRILYGSEINLAEVAFNLGFYDQAHLFNEIKEMMGKAPSKIAEAIEVKSRIFVTAKQ